MLEIERHISQISCIVRIGFPLSLSEFPVSVITFVISCFANFVFLNFADIVEFSSLFLLVSIVDDMDAIASLSSIVAKSLGVVVHIANVFAILSLQLKLL